ncbi:MAG: amidohydrolase family protein, partial [Gemmatimonadales bacterium]
MRYAFLFLLAATLATPIHAQHDVWALTNVRIVPVSGPPIASGTIVLRDGLIAAVGANVPVPADARVLDLAGHTVYPGLIDLQSAAGVPPDRRPTGGGLSAALAAQQDTGGWRGLDPDRMVRDDLRPADAAIREWRETGVLTGLVAPQRGPMRAQAALVNFSGDAGRMVIDPRAALSMGFEGVQGRYPGTLMAVMAWQRQQFLDAQHLAAVRARYQTNPRGMERPTASPGLDALEPYATGRGLVIFDARSERAIRRAAGLGQEFSLNYAIGTAGEAWLALDVLRTAARPVLVSVHFAHPDSLTGTAFLRTRQGAMPSDASLQALIDRNPAAVDSAGLRYALTSGGRMRAADFLPHVRRAIAAGLSADAALRALTIEPARIVGADNRLGTIEAGKIANLVVTSGDLFGDSTRVVMTFVDGERFALPPVAAAGAARRPAQRAQRDTATAAPALAT